MKWGDGFIILALGRGCSAQSGDGEGEGLLTAAGQSSCVDCVCARATPAGRTRDLRLQRRLSLHPSLSSAPAVGAAVISWGVGGVHLLPARRLLRGATFLLSPDSAAGAPSRRS